MKALDIEDPQFQFYLRNLEETHEIAASIGASKPDNELAERVHLEVGFIAPIEVANYCQHMTLKWLKEKNPYIADLLISACNRNGIMPTPSLMTVLSQAAEMRLNGEPAGTPDKLKNESAQQQALTLMANLIFAGDSLREASRKAARWHRNNFSKLKRQKASTLETYYTEKMRSPGIEDDLFDNWRRNLDLRDEQRLNKLWQEIRQHLQPADDDLTGVRRR